MSCCWVTWCLLLLCLLCLLSVIWNSECAFLSMAHSSSSGSNQRMLGNTPAVRATALVSRRQHQPTWLFSVSVTVATKCRGRGDDGCIKGAAAATSRLLVLEAVVLWGSALQFSNFNFTLSFKVKGYTEGYGIIPLFHIPGYFYVIHCDSSLVPMLKNMLHPCDSGPRDTQWPDCFINSYWILGRLCLLLITVLSGRRCGWSAALQPQAPI